MLYFVLVLKCHPQRLENRQAELQLSLQHKTSAAPAHLLVLAAAGTTTPVRVLLTIYLQLSFLTLLYNL